MRLSSKRALALETFLEQQQKGLFFSYVERVDRVHTWGGLDNLIKHHKFALIDKTLVWEEQEEGFDYWKEISSKWESLYFALERKDFFEAPLW